MADDPKTDPDPKDDPATGDPADEGDDDLGDKGKKALSAERKKARDAEKAAADLRTKLKELEDADKSEVQKLRDENAELTKDLNNAKARALRLEIAGEKGVKPRYLTGDTREELEAAADEYLEDHPPAEAGATPPPPSRKPAVALQGGSNPTESPIETDPAKLADAVPRL